MKIEKINENQIRCTLTHADLVERELKLSELAYGTEKAKSLFQDMMQQAASELGFEANDIPLMIEAIPASADSIVLIITKVEDPDELDTRFSRFAPSPLGDSERKASALDRLKKLEGGEDFLDILKRLKEVGSGSAPDSGKEEVLPAQPEAKDETPVSTIRFFAFDTINSVIMASQMLAKMYFGSNTLYKDHEKEEYVLVLTQSEHSLTDFNRICNMLSEYGSSEHGNGASLAYLEEHCDTILASDAIQQLAAL